MNNVKWTIFGDITFGWFLLWEASFAFFSLVYVALITMSYSHLQASLGSGKIFQILHKFEGKVTPIYLV